MPLLGGHGADVGRTHRRPDSGSPDAFPLAASLLAMVLSRIVLGFDAPSFHRTIGR